MNDNVHFKVLLLIFLISILLLFKEIAKFLMTKTKTTLATISSKQINSRSTVSSKGAVHYYNEYVVQFNLEDGTMIEFSVPEEQYFTFIEGTNGKITYKGYKLISFEEGCKGGKIC